MCLDASLRAQQETSATLTGVVESFDGRLLDNLRVEVVHGPTGSLSVSHPNRRGLYALTGLAVGGPYAITVQADAHETRRFDNVYLLLGETRVLNVSLSPVGGSPVRLEAMKVGGERLASPVGPASMMDEEVIGAFPTIEGSINEIASLDPRVVYVDPERGEVTAAGQNSRYNSLSVDGVKINDLFGVESSGLPSQGNPLSIETLEMVSVETSPFDVNRGGFVGASINMVTKSGTNTFRGSAYYNYRNEKWRAKHPITGERDPFVDETAGVTFGGPLVRGKLFFFLAYERSSRTEPAPAPGFTPTLEALSRVVDAAARYGYNPGELTSPGQPDKSDFKWVAKVDWRISGEHRASFRLSDTRGSQPVAPRYSTSGSVSLNGYWYDSDKDLLAWSGQLFSRWTPNLQTEVKVAQHRYEALRSPRSRFPQVLIDNVPGDDGGEGKVYLGTEESTQLNSLVTDKTEVGASLTWLAGRHRVLFGAEVERSEFENTYLRHAFGSYRFVSIEAFSAGTPWSYEHQYALPGRTPDVSWGYTMGSLFVQDTWMPLPQLTLTAGIRLDYPKASSAPVYNKLVHDTFGYRNDSTVGDTFTIGPRASFRYRFHEDWRTVVRGGVGVFQGRAPGVWLSNAYLYDGGKIGTTTWVDGFSPDPDHQPGSGVANRRQSIDLIDGNFHLPSAARATVALDQPLPWLDAQLSLEWVQTWTLEGLAYRNLNLQPTALGPDGRVMYGHRTHTGAAVGGSEYRHDAFTDVFLLTNTNKGGSRQATISLTKPLKKRWGASVSYTHTNADDVSPVSSSTAATNFSTRVGRDPNDERVGTSNYEIRHRILAQVSVRFAAVRRFDTRLTLQYEGRSGRPYSYVFGNDANGDGVTYDNDLFYVPAGREDPRVRWAVARQKEAFFQWLEGSPRVKRYAGQMMPRNSERSRFSHQFDLKITQAVPLGGRFRGEVFLDIDNLGNLLNDEWGRVYAASFPYVLSVANANYDPIANQYVYRFTGAKAEVLQPGVSRWQLRGGLKVRF